MGAATSAREAATTRSRTCVLTSGHVVQRPAARYPFQIAVERSGLVFVGPRSVVAGFGAHHVRVNPDCKPVPNRSRRLSGLSGPWPTTLRSEIFCGTATRNRLTFQISPIRNKRSLVIGNRVVAALGQEVLVHASLTGSAGKVWFNPTYCLRTATP